MKLGVVAAALPGVARMLGVVAACAACAADADFSGADAAGEESSDPWGPAVELELLAQGERLLSAPFTVEGGGRGFALFVEGESCLQVARLESGTPAQIWVPGLERGVSCADCAERFSVVAESGLVVHSPPEPDDSDATIRFGGIDCKSLAPISPWRPAEPAFLRVRIRPLPPARDVEPLPLAFLHGSASPWPAPEAAARLATGVGALLAEAGLEVELVASSKDPRLDAPIEWFEGTPGGLPLLGEEKTRSLRVAFGGCMERIHPLLGTRVLLDGFVPRVAALGTPGAAVYVRHRGCTSDSAVVRSEDREARLIAHELGHFLGLYHPEDANGARDRLPDTEKGTLMAASPAVAESPLFSPLQAQRMRLHAALLSDGLPPAGAAMSADAP